MSLIAENIYKSYNDRLILNDISLTVNPHEIVVLTGKSGIGKTTLLNCLSLLEKADKGTIKCDGIDYTLSSHNEFKKVNLYPLATVVFQQLFLFPHLTNLENIIFGIKPNRKKSITDIFKKKNCNNLHDTIVHTLIKNNVEPTDKLISEIEAMVDELELSEFIMNYPNQSSRGEKQRIALARVMNLDSKYIFMDEITASLDGDGVDIIINTIKRLRDQGKGLFVITHDKYVAKEIADKLIVLENGRIQNV